MVIQFVSPTLASSGQMINANPGRPALTKQLVHSPGQTSISTLAPARLVERSFDAPERLGQRDTVRALLTYRVYGFGERI